MSSEAFCRGGLVRVATVLVIEDSNGQRAEVCAALEASGLFDCVIEANDGIEGLKLLLSEAPDLVLCNLEMPGLDGEKLLRMRQSRGNSESAIPFLVLTAATDPETTFAGLLIARRGTRIVAATWVQVGDAELTM